MTDAICNAAVDLTDDMAVKAIVTMTHSGYTAFKISSMRPKATIHAFTNNAVHPHPPEPGVGRARALLRQVREHRRHHRRHQAVPGAKNAM